MKNVNGTAAEAARAEALEAGRECFEAALQYLSLGWSPGALCPPDHYRMTDNHAKECGSPGKRPWHRWKDLQDKAADERTVRGWWRDHPDSNVGVFLGPVSGLIGIDVDGDEGERELQRVSGGDIPLTWKFTSGKGYRLLFRHPDGVTVRSTHFGPDEERRPL